MAPPTAAAAAGGGATASSDNAAVMQEQQRQRLAGCLAELQGALGVVEQYTEGTQGSITQHEKFAATKMVYYALCRLNGLLLGSVSKEALLPLEGPLVQGATAVLCSKKLALSPPFRRALAECFALLLQKSTTLGIFSLVKDMQAILLTPSKAVLPPLARVAALETLTLALQIKAAQLSPGLVAEAQAAIAKNWKSASTSSSTLSGQCSPADLITLKCAALEAMSATRGMAAKLEIFKAIKLAAADKAPEVRSAAATALIAILRPERAEDDFRAVSLDAYLTLGLKGVADDITGGLSSSPSPAVQLQWAEALAHILAVSVAGQADRAKARSIRAARGGVIETEQDTSTATNTKARPPVIVEEGEEVPSSTTTGLPDMPSGGKSKGLQATMAGKLKSLTAMAARRPNSPAPSSNTTSSSDHTPSLSLSKGAAGSKHTNPTATAAAAPPALFLHTFESAVQYLIALFLKANGGNNTLHPSSTAANPSAASTSSTAATVARGPLHRAGIAAALVAFLRRHRQQLAAKEDTLQWLLGVLLSAVARPGRAKAALKEDLGLRAGVAHILHAGLCKGAPEQVQTPLATALARLLLDSSPSLSPLQLQLALGQLTLLLPILGESAATVLLPLRPCSSETDEATGNGDLPHLPRRLLALCRHGSYGVRVEAAVALSTLVQTLPHMALLTLTATAAAVRSEYEALEALLIFDDGGEGQEEEEESSSSEEDEGGDDEDEEEEEGKGEGGGTGDSGGSRVLPPDVTASKGSSNNSRVKGPLQGVVKKGRGRRRVNGGTDGERRRRVCALHGCGSALVLLLKGTRALLDVTLPASLLEDVMATAKQLVNQAFGPQARRWATAVRTGWAIFGALLHQGGNSHTTVGGQVGGVALRPFFHLLGRCVELEAGQQQQQLNNHDNGPSHLLESMLGALLILVRECPQALATAPGALTSARSLLDKALDLLPIPSSPLPPPLYAGGGNGPLSASSSVGGGDIPLSSSCSSPPYGVGGNGTTTRMALIHATVLEAYAFLLPLSPSSPSVPTNGPSSTPRLFDWALSYIMPLPNNAGGGEAAESAETSLLTAWLQDHQEEDSPPLESRSAIRSSFSSNGNASMASSLEGALLASRGGGGGEDVLALWVQTRGTALEDREREAAIATGAMGPPFSPAASDDGRSSPVRPPPPHPSARVRALDAAICLLAQTFPLQTPARRGEAIALLLSLLPPPLRAIEYLTPSAAAAAAASASADTIDAGINTGAAAADAPPPPSSSSSTNEEGKRRVRREGGQGLAVAAVARNVATALLGIVRALPSCSSYSTETEGWVLQMREGLFGLLGSPAPRVRRAACEALCLLLAQHAIPGGSSSSSGNDGGPTTGHTGHAGSSSSSGGGAALLEHTVSCLVEVAMRGDTSMNGTAAASTSATTSGLASLMPKSAAATAAAAAAAAGADLQACRAAGATVALASLRRALGPALVRLQPCWAAVQCLMVADTPQPLRTWALHALSLLVKRMQGLGGATGGQESVQTLGTLLEMLEAHFLAPWATPLTSVQATDNEPGLLVALTRLLTALLPAVIDLQHDGEGEEEGRGPLWKLKAMLRILAAHPDDRLALECCHALELLALFRPNDPWLAAPETVDLLRTALQGGHSGRRLACALDPLLAPLTAAAAACEPPPAPAAPAFPIGGHTLSPPLCAAALSCLRALAKRHAPVLRAQRMEATLLSLIDAIAAASSSSPGQCWGGRIALLPPFPLSTTPMHSLEDATRATFSVLMESEGGDPLHYLLLARAAVLGGVSASAVEEEEGGPVAASLMAAGGEGDMAMEAAIAERLRARAAGAVSGLPAGARWQAKAFLMDVALQCLASLEKQLASLCPDPSALHQEARRLIRRFFQQQQAQQEGGGSGPSSFSSSPRSSSSPPISLSSLERSPLLLATLLPDIVALGCHAAAASAAAAVGQGEKGEGVGLVGLQLKGVEVLRTLVRLFGRVPDPDAPPDEDSGRPPLLLAQYVTQFTTALAPVLSNGLSAPLVQAGCALLLAGVESGLFNDPVVLKRLLARLLPPSSPPPPPTLLLAPYEHPATDIDTSLCIRAVQRVALAAVFTLAMREGEEEGGCMVLSPAAQRGLRWFFVGEFGGSSSSSGTKRQQPSDSSLLLDRLLPEWVNGLADALRLLLFQRSQQPQGQDPSSSWTQILFSSTRDSWPEGSGGCTYGADSDTGRLAPFYAPGWPLLLAGAALALSTLLLPPAPHDDSRHRAYAFLLAATEAALQQQQQQQQQQQEHASSLLPSLSLRTCALLALGALMTNEPLALAAAAAPQSKEGQEEEEEEEEGAEAPAPSIALPPARFAHLLKAVTAPAGTEEAGVGVVKRLLASHPAVVGRLLQLEEEGGEEGEGSLWEAVEEAALLPFHLLLQDSCTPPPPTTTLTPSLQTALSLPAALPPLCPPSRRKEALPRLLALGLRQLTLGLEEEEGQQQQRDSALSAAFMHAGYGLLRAVFASSVSVNSGGDNGAVLSSALAATLGEALVAVVSKGLAISDDRGRLGWEGWLAALPPPDNNAADVEGVIEAGLAWAAATATATSAAAATAFQHEDEEMAFAPPSSLPSPLGTRVRAILLAGARATVQARGPRAAQMLRLFGPAAVEVLSSVSPAPAAAPLASSINSADGNDSWGFPSSSSSSSSSSTTITATAHEEQEDDERHLLLTEATKLLLLGFTFLPPPSDPSLPALQTRHLALSLPLLSRLLRHRPTTMQPLLAPALLAIAKASPGPFKEQVQRLSVEDKQALEGALRAAVVANGAVSERSAAVPSSSLKTIDMARYA